MPLEVLHLPLVFLGGGARIERAEIAPLARARIDLARIKSILPGSQLANHRQHAIGMTDASSYSAPGGARGDGAEIASTSLPA